MMLSKVEYKALYEPKAEPTIQYIPKLRFITITGEGDPNGQVFQSHVEALYSISYAIKMSYKKEPPQGYYDYKVFPLEGVWDLVDKTKPITDKSNYRYHLMIQQPDFVDEDLFDHFQKQVMKKKDNPYLNKLKYAVIEEGWVCQMLHIGPYDDEPKTFTTMMDYVQSIGYERIHKGHREIYISDPRRSEPQKMKTILRFSIQKK